MPRVHMNVVRMWCEVGFKVDEKEGANTVKGSIQREENGMSLDPDSL